MGSRASGLERAKERTMLRWREPEDAPVRDFIHQKARSDFEGNVSKAIRTILRERYEQDASVHA